MRVWCVCVYVCVVCVYVCVLQFNVYVKQVMTKINKAMGIAPLIFWCENWAVVNQMEKDLRQGRRNV
jgi:hypothetical protein